MPSAIFMPPWLKVQCYICRTGMLPATFREFTYGVRWLLNVEKVQTRYHMWEWSWLMSDWMASDHNWLAEGRVRVHFSNKSKGRSQWLGYLLSRQGSGQKGNRNPNQGKISGQDYSYPDKGQTGSQATAVIQDKASQRYRRQKAECYHKPRWVKLWAYDGQI